MGLTTERKLGRRKPLAQVDFNRSRIVTAADNTRRVFARLDAHTDHSKATVTPPAQFDYSRLAFAAVHTMDLNDQLGDCVIASRYHNIGILAGNETRQTLIPTDDEIRSTYVAACGPGDQGCDMSAVCTFRQKNGFPVQGVVYKTGGAVAVDYTKQQLVTVALYVFGGLDVGLNLPQTWYNSANFADWGPVPGDTIVGGHEVQAFGADNKGVWINTWGSKRRILWTAFLANGTWIDELYAELSPLWTANKSLAPNGINAATLAADLTAIGNGDVP